MTIHIKRRPLIILLGLLVALLAAMGIYKYRVSVQGNFAAVVDGQVYRSAQPTTQQIRDWSSKYSLKTIVNLRGSDEPGWASEQQAAAGAGVGLIPARCSAREMPSSLWVRQMVEILETAPRPMLIHCNGGADRTGVASVLAAMAVGGQDYQQAKEQLSAKYGHLDLRAGSIAGLLDKYEAYCHENNLHTAGWSQFRKWAVEVYHPQYYCLDIHAPADISCHAGKGVEISVTITNTSAETLPAADPARRFSLTCFAGLGVDENPQREFGPRVQLPKRDIKPGEKIELKYLVQPPPAGAYAAHFDVIEEGKTWFSRQGSPMPSCTLKVAP